MKKGIFTRYLLALLLSGGMITFSANAQEDNAQVDDTEDVFEMSLEDLLNVEVTSVSKKAERLQDVASSIYVITEEDINRSGATRIADVLQMVPGVYFGFDNYNDVEFSIRENADNFLGTVLVLLDNVPLQSPFTSTFDWANFDIPLREIDRIEVIKGPGGTIYGANAATGVINIFTKSPEESQGWRASVQTGSRSFISPSLRYGTKLGDNTSISVFGKGTFFDGFAPLDELDGNYVTVPKTALSQNPMTGQMLGTGTSSGDTLIENQYRADIYRTDKLSGGFSVLSHVTDKLDIRGNFFFTNHKRNMYFPELGFNTLALREENNNRLVMSVRGDYTFSDNHSMFIQYSDNRESVVNDVTSQKTSTMNLEIQDNLTVGINNLSFGVNVRNVNFRVGPYGTSTGINFIEPNVSQQLYGVFVQDQINIGDKLTATLGAKAEIWTLIDNEPELSPSARLAYRPTNNWTLWGAASRSVTTPGFIQTNIEFTLLPQMPPFVPYPIALVNGEDTDQSEYITYEAGVKGTIDKLYVEATGFYVQADDIVGSASGGNMPVPSVVNPNDSILPLFYANLLESEIYGVEFLSKYRFSDAFSVELSYSYLNISRTGKENPATGEKVTAPDPTGTPEHIVRMRNYINPGKDWYISFNHMFFTEAGTNRFFYDQQRPQPLANPDDDGIQLQDPSARYRLDFKIEKRFNDDNASVFIWGTDVLNTGTIENYNSIATGLPMQTHAIFGVGANFKI